MSSVSLVLKRIMVLFCGPGRFRMLRIALFCFLLSLIGGAILLLILGKNPLLAYKSLLQGAGVLPKLRYPGKKSQLTDILNLINYTTPMIFASLAVAVGMKCGLFNIFVSGTMILSGFIATVLVGYSPMAPLLAKPLVVLIGLIVGGSVGALVGWLKYKYNLNEVVFAIMFNYIISYVVSFFIQTQYIDPVSRQSIPVGKHAMLTLVDVEAGGLRMNIALLFPVAILCIFLIDFLLRKTRMGFEIKAVGLNAKASRYAGMKVGRSTLIAMIISGAFAGLAGVSYYLGSFGSIQPRVVPPLGFDAIAVALLGNINAFGCFFASFIIMIFDSGTSYLSSKLGVLREIAALITSILLLFSAGSAYFKSVGTRLSLEKDKE